MGYNVFTSHPGRAPPFLEELLGLSFVLCLSLVEDTSEEEGRGLSLHALGNVIAS
jgi:hypothetical protein